MKRIILLVALALLFGCAQAKDFKYGAKQVFELNSKYGNSMETYPNSLEQIDSMLSEYQELKKLPLETGKEPFNYIVDYRILNLEAEKLYIQGQKYGDSGTTAKGFGCKQRPLIIESVALRNSSALKGFEGVVLLREFVEKFPEESSFANLSEKNALFINATFYEISRNARRDSNTINNFCPANITLEIYQQEFRKKSNMSEELISNLTYEKAVVIWKKSREIK